MDEQCEKLGAFEIWTFQRMLRISWTKPKTAEKVLQLANTKRIITHNFLRTKEAKVFWSQSKNTKYMETRRKDKWQTVERKT